LPVITLVFQSCIYAIQSVIYIGCIKEDVVVVIVVVVAVVVVVNSLLSEFRQIVYFKCESKT